MRCAHQSVQQRPPTHHNLRPFICFSSLLTCEQGLLQAGVMRSLWCTKSLNNGASACLSGTPTSFIFFWGGCKLKCPIFCQSVFLRCASPFIVSTPAAKKRLTWRGFFFSLQGGSPDPERPAGVDRSPAKHTSGGRSVPPLYSDSLCTLKVHQTFMFIYVHADVCVLLSSSLKAWISPSTSRPLTDVFGIEEPHH